MLWNTVKRALGFGLLLFMLSPSTQAEEDIESLVPCIIQVESGGNPLAVGSSGEIGLMQISPIVFREYCREEIGDEIGEFTQRYFHKLYDKELNIRVGTWYLRRLKDHYLKENYTVERLLAAYNGGITRLRKNNYDVSKMPKSTLHYIKKVLKCRRKQ